MYNRYIPASQQPRTDRERTNHTYSRPSDGSGFGQQWVRQFWGPFHRFGGESKNAGIAGILKGLGLDDPDGGDILLLLLILLLIFLEGDNTELVITLGLMLLLSGDEDQKE